MFGTVSNQLALVKIRPRKNTFFLRAHIFQLKVLRKKNYIVPMNLRELEFSRFRKNKEK